MKISSVKEWSECRTTNSVVCNFDIHSFWPGALHFISCSVSKLPPCLIESVVMSVKFSSIPNYLCRIESLAQIVIWIKFWKIALLLILLLWKTFWYIFPGCTLSRLLWCLTDLVLARRKEPNGGHCPNR